ncbi:MAG TPA: hypothetical protein VLM85_14765, partial [Polyangiaceae bacterium]|nr:hypothetical protein [Polyangiaceae bacterium]
VATALVSGATSVSVGNLGACATTPTDPFCWGSNATGLLGTGPDGGTPPSGTPLDMNTLASAVAISSANGHACAILGDGSVTCWGLNDHGQCGDGTTTDRTTPGTVAGITNAIAIAAGSAHTCAWARDGIYCWGDDSLGQLGDGRSSGDGGPLLSTTPVKIVIP